MNESPEQRAERIDTLHGVMFAPAGDLITQNLQQFSAFTRNELAMLRDVILPGDNILDIGAHIGAFALPLARFNEGQGRIFAFEPSPESFAWLVQNIRANGLEQVIIPHQALVYDRQAAFERISPDRGNTGACYYLPAADQNAPSPEVIQLDDWHARMHPELPIALIKIDVEGAEVAVLQSCRHLLERFLPVLYIEVSRQQLARFGRTPEAIQALLEPLGYDFFKNIGQRHSHHDFYSMVRLSGLGQGGDFFDVLAIHASSPRYPTFFQPPAPPG
ncbi:MAG: FkbM family methyltransferase [Candidatus Sericytochromatia bacterium]